jgi:hypothetical protein
MTLSHFSNAQDKASPILDAAGWLLKWAESMAGLAFVRTISALRIALQWCDPRIHAESLRIHAIADGQFDRNSRKVALLLLYSPGPVPAFTRSFIEALNRSTFDLVVVSNHPLDTAAKAYVLSRCRLLIERANVGRDFGGYKDGIAIIQRRYPQAERLLIANDSVFYLPGGLDGLIDELVGEHEFIGVSEIFEHHYHVASFLASFGPAVLRSDAFRGFWARYRPIGTRRWAILHGEGALTRTLVGAGFQPHVLYQTGALRSRLQGLPVERILTEAKVLPSRARRKLLEKWQGAGNRQDARRLADDIADAIGARNQMHYGGFLFRRHLGLPIVKRDLVYREIYSLQDALANLDDLDAPFRDAIAADFRARLTPQDLDPLRRMFYRHGAI